jgi:4-diphosphocytidyl-2C-methyl-D-erythritol kinase
LRRPRSDSASVRAGEALQRGDFAAVQALLHNDFEPVIAGAYRPIGAALEALRAAGAERPMLSGSGAATFALCRTQADAQTIAQRLTRLTDAHVAVVAFAASPVWTATP